MSVKNNQGIDHVNIDKILKKTSRKMTLRILGICILCLSLLVFLVNLPFMLQHFQRDRINNAQHIAMIHQQFNYPARINGFSRESMPMFSNKVPINISYRNRIGINPLALDQVDNQYQYNVFTGKINIPYSNATFFMHPSRYKQLDQGNRNMILHESAAALSTLEKNQDTTVAIMDISFTETYAIEELMSMPVLGSLNLDIQWLAIETGLESQMPRLGNMPSQQYFIWGIPTSFYTPEKIFEPYYINYADSQEYTDRILRELDWAKERSNMLSKNNLDMVGFNRNEVFNTSEYLRENGFKVYGVRLNGPSDQLLLFAQQIEYNSINIPKMDFWNWYETK